MKSIKNLIMLSLVNYYFRLNLNAQSINKKSLSELTKIEPKT